MKKYLFLLLISIVVGNLFAQKKPVAYVQGTLITAANQPAINASVEIPLLKMLVYVNADGSFNFSSVPYGNYNIIVAGGYKFSNNAALNKDNSITISVDKPMVNLGSLIVATTESAPTYTSGQLPTIALEENSSSAEDEGISNQNISGLLTASRDPYLAAAAYTFGPLRYRTRGYNSDQLDVMMNGVPMNDAETDRATWWQWGGLNDVFRNQTTSFGLEAADEGFGGLLGLTQIDATAASQRQQTRISYSRSNRSYRNRLMLTHSTGLMQNGWAYSFSLSKRWAQEGYIPGTFYDAYAYYVGISKKLGNKSFLHFTTFGAPTQRGKASPTTQEAMDIAGSHFYNPNWGWQDGEKRNSRINNSFLPTAILNYVYTPNTTTNLNVALAYQQGFVGNSSIDWYNALDPRPDYYRKLPSFYLYDPKGADTGMYNEVLQDLENDPSQMQMDWDRLYQANRMNYDSINGAAGNRSIYVIGQDRDDIKKISFAANLQKVIGDHIKLYTGFSYVSQQTESYKKLLDLLGGDYYVNLNQFAERTYIGNDTYNQNDMNNPNRIVREGDKYSYDYKVHYNNANWWGQSVFSYNKVDFFLAANLGLNSFYRDGMYKNGLFPTDSYGKSKTQSFFTGGVKGGITYKIDGRNYIYANAGYMTDAPTFENTFISSRTRNMTINDPHVEKITTLEGGYILHAPYISGRLTGFVTDIKDATVIKHFYDDDYRTFVNYSMTGVNTRNLGVEFAIKAKLSPSLSASLVAAWMQAFYTDRTQSKIYLDNDTTTKVASVTNYIKDYFIAAGPQSAYTLGFNYRSPKYWYANINFNYLDRNYVDINPARRTSEALGITTPESPAGVAMLAQKKLPSAFTIDLFFGKSFLLSRSMKWLPHGTYLYVNVGVNNILNNKNIVTGAFEQMRFDNQNLNPDRFPNKYFYSYGTNYFINLSLKF